MHSDYLQPAIRELRDQQVRFAPRRKKIEMVDSAERLLSELEPDRTYPYQYLCFQITNYRSERYADLQISGQEAKHDLLYFIEDLSDSADIPADAAGEPVLTVQELSRRFRVATKTISRWRRQGLVSRRFVFDGRKRVGFLQSSVDRFVERNQELVRRGARFSQLTDWEKRKIIQGARRLALAGANASEAIRRLARLTGRSIETIRYTLKQFDENHPDAAVFPEGSGSLREESKQDIYQQFRRGESVESLAQRFCRTKTSIYRIVAETRARRILELPLDYIPNEQFEKVGPEEEESILGPPPPSGQRVRRPRLPSGLPPYLAGLYEVPLLLSPRQPAQIHWPPAALSPTVPRWSLSGS